MLACVIQPTEKTDTKRCLACEFWCAIVPEDTTGMLACNDFRMLMRHRAVRKRQARRRATSYECSSVPSCRQKRQTRWHVSWPLRSKAMRAVSSGNDAGRKATCEITAISATQAHPASARHQLGQRAARKHPPGSLPLSHFSVNPIRLEMATLIRKHQVLKAQQFILRPLNLRPRTVVVRDFQDGNGICNGDIPSKSEPHGSTFCQVLQKPSRFLWRPTSSIKAFLRRLKGASIPQTHFGAPRSGAPFLWVDGCRQLLIRHGK